jgi:3-hydroxymyristoyl/3-hydroxydecanoyl-(acyl carrier protein) dehydratase
MNFIQNVRWDKTGGKYGKGLIFASKEINSQDWFYRCHFFQDPVMPGSLGVEAVLQTLAVYAVQSCLVTKEAGARMAPAVNFPLRWKYRGQFTPVNKVLRLVIDINHAEPNENGFILGGDASVWADKTRIYEINGIAVRFSQESR